MEKLNDTATLKFKPNTLEEVRNGLGLTHDGIVKMLDSFEDWIAKQNHFTTRKFDRHYLETSILFTKGSLERAKNTLDKLCTMKTLLPNFFTKYNGKKDLRDTSGFMIQATLPNLLPNNYRLYCAKIVSTDFDAAMFFDFHRFAIMKCEYIKMNDYSFGFVCLIDCRDLNLINFVAKLDVLDLRNSMAVMMEGYGLRINAMYVLSASKTVEVLTSLLKQVVSAKIGGRIHVIKSIEELCEHIPRESLPKDYGGDQPSVLDAYENWKETFNTTENVTFMREIFNARTDEKYRLTEKYNNSVLGMPGSFRTLNVD